MNEQQTDRQTDCANNSRRDIINMRHKNTSHANIEQLKFNTVISLKHT